MELYIWTNFSPERTGGLAFAIAQNEAEARCLVIKEHGYEPMTWGDLDIRPVGWRTAKTAPSRK